MQVRAVEEAVYSLVCLHRSALNGQKCDVCGKKFYRRSDGWAGELLEHMTRGREICKGIMLL